MIISLKEITQQKYPLKKKRLTDSIAFNIRSKIHLHPNKGDYQPTYLRITNFLGQITQITKSNLTELDIMVDHVGKVELTSSTMWITSRIRMKSI
jgi:hypothetical protein